MAILNFQARFVPKIESGEKTHTIRAHRKVPIRSGETLHLYTGLRRKGARLLMRVPCTRVQTISMALRDHVGLEITIDGIQLAKDERDAFARRDGFQQFKDMLVFWDGLFPFHGQVIHWDYKRRATQ